MFEGLSVFCGPFNAPRGPKMENKSSVNPTLQNHPPVNCKRRPSHWLEIVSEWELLLFRFLSEDSIYGSTKEDQNLLSFW